MGRLTVDDWLEAGFDVLRRDGAAALTIERLTRRLRVTKGSFYHHFSSRDDFVRALLGRWEQKLTLELIEASREGLGFADRSRRLTRLGRRLFEPRLEVAIRAWALRDPMVMEFQRRVDEERLSYLEELFRQAAGDPRQACDMALIRYAFSVGAQQLQPELEPEHYARLFKLLNEQLVAMALTSRHPNGGST